MLPAPSAPAQDLEHSVGATPLGGKPTPTRLGVGVQLTRVSPQQGPRKHPAFRTTEGLCWSRRPTPTHTGFSRRSSSLHRLSCLAHRCMPNTSGDDSMLPRRLTVRDPRRSSPRAGSDRPHDTPAGGFFACRSLRIFGTCPTAVVGAGWRGRGDDLRISGRLAVTLTRKIRRRIGDVTLGWSQLSLAPGSNQKWKPRTNVPLVAAVEAGL